MDAADGPLSVISFLDSCIRVSKRFLQRFPFGHWLNAGLLNSATIDYIAALEAALSRNPEIIGQWALDPQFDIISRDGKKLLDEMSNLLERPREKSTFRGVLHRADLQNLRSRVRIQVTRLEILFKTTSMLRVAEGASVVEGVRRTRSVGQKIIIAVMGPSGVGKSRIISDIIGSTDIRVGHGLSSETQTIVPYSLTIGDCLITLVDMPGFTDGEDAETLQRVADWLSKSHRRGQRLSGILYLQPITSPRMTGNAAKNLEVFEKMVGLDSLKNVVLVTTMWDLLADGSTGVARENQLKKQFWVPMIERGSRVARFRGDLFSALNILKMVALDRRNISKPALAIQRELVDEGKALIGTAAGRYLRQNLDTKLVYQTEERRKWMDNFRFDLMQVEELSSGPLTKTETVEPFRDGSDRRLLTLGNDTSQIETQGSAESPPTYANTDLRSVSRPNSWLGHFTAAAKQRFFKIYHYSAHVLQKALRPSVSKGFTRIEWTCSCGDLLYGDFREASPGSLQIFAARLQGKILNPHFDASGGSQESPGNVTTPQSVHLRDTPGKPPPGKKSSSQRVPGDTSSDNSSSEAAIASSSVAASMKKMPGSNNMFLELCVRLDRYRYSLGEIDVSGNLSDRAIFTKIKAKYEELQFCPLILGPFRPRLPTGGYFVKFRIDQRRLSPDGKVQNLEVAILNGPPVPPEDEVINGTYEYDPIPMDEPVMPPDIFLHYFTKPTDAHNERWWSTRFPLRTGDRLYYTKERLAKGWGVRIEEGHNWLFFHVCSLLGLLVSGGVAAVYAKAQGDVQTGVAIGAWISTVQGLLVAILFLVWG